MAIVCAGLSGMAAMLWVEHQRATETQVLPSAARIQRVDGEVALNHSLDNSGSEERWIEATQNTPVSVGDRIYAHGNSRAAIAFTGRNFARLDEHASLDVLSLSDQRTQLALREGSALFNVGSLAPGELFEVATPYGAVDFNQPGLYQIAYDDQGSAVVSVLSGLAQVVGLGGTGQIGRGEMLTLLGQAATEVVLSRLDPAYAGTLVNDYYGYQYPRIYDGRYRDYDAYLNDPYYYDPYSRYVSYQYVADAIPGVDDLDYYGDWREVSSYGYAWHPRVDADWAPYQQGYWSTDDPYGLTWVSNEPWGYAPYHYGRWVYVDDQWFWIPERVNTRPAYSPALVAFVPLVEENVIGWVPLGPGDPYAPRYYDASWQPHYLTQTQTVQGQIVNLQVPGALTFVPVRDFSRVINQSIITRVDPQKLAQLRPVVDPFAVETLRQAALQTARARRKIDVPQDVARRIDNTRVIASTTPVATPFRKELARALKVESVSDKQRQEKLEFKDNRQPVVAEQQPGASRQQEADRATAPSDKDQERDQRKAALADEAAKGNKEARREMKQLERQQQREERAQQSAARQQEAVTQKQDGAAARAENERRPERAQGERVGQQLKAQREEGRQQAIVERREQREAKQQRVEARKQSNQETAMRRGQRAAAQRESQGKARAQQSQEPQRVKQQRAIERGQAKPTPQAAKSKAERPAGKGKGRP
ncbi:MAG TPA: DUF6600 domain-containing protein [Pyrinomonadaceae bacterium]